MEHQRTMKHKASLKLPRGISDFSQIRTGEYFYVDKTRFIESICNCGCFAYLIARPSGFGKSLCLSMLRRFFEIGSDKSVFDGLYISKNTEICEKYQGKYPVISISFQDVNADNYETARKQLEEAVIREAKRFDFLKDCDELDDNQRQHYLAVLKPEKDLVDLVGSLWKLAMVLQEYYKHRVIFLVDDWDTPMLAAARYGYYDQMAWTIRRIIEIVAGDSDRVEFSVLIGCLHVPVGGGYFDPYNYKYDSILSGAVVDAGGFEESDVKAVLEYYELPDYMEEVKQHCGGYQIIQTNLFSPTLVFDFITEKIGNNAEMKQRQIVEKIEYKKLDAILSCENYFDVEAYSSLKELLEGESVQTQMNPYVKYKDKNYIFANSLWSILLLYGYLTVKSRKKYVGIDVYTATLSNDKSRERLQAWLTAWESQDKGSKEYEP